MNRKRFVLAAAIATLMTTSAVAVGTQRSTSKPQPLSGGASGVIELQNCGRVGFVAAPINQSLTCPADRPILNGMVFGAQTRLASTNGAAVGSFGVAELDLICCQLAQK
jgi:hypothetical protein